MRRKAVYESVFQGPRQTHEFIASYLRELSEAQEPEKRPRVVTGQPTVRTEQWRPPPEGTVKLNVDGAVENQGNFGASAVVCRDHNGLYLESSSLVTQMVDPATLEAYALREALALAEDLGAQRLHVASDCLTVINDIHQRTGDGMER